MKLGDKHAKEYGYKRYVGAEVKVTGKVYDNGLIEVKMKVEDIPFPVSIAVHKEDVSY